MDKNNVKKNKANIKLAVFNKVSLIHYAEELFVYIENSDNCFKWPKIHFFYFFCFLESHFKKCWFEICFHNPLLVINGH